MLPLYPEFLPIRFHRIVGFLGGFSGLILTTGATGCRVPVVESGAIFLNVGVTRQSIQDQSYVNL